MQRIVWALVVSAVLASAQPNALPRLERRGSVSQLIVDGKPFLALGGELLNNSASSLEYMTPMWPRLRSMHLNTLLAPISWAQFEPTEGKFDYTLTVQSASRPSAMPAAMPMRALSRR